MLTDNSSNSNNPAALCINQKICLASRKLRRNMLRRNEITCPHIFQFWRLTRNRDKKSSSAKLATNARRILMLHLSNKTYAFENIIWNTHGQIISLLNAKPSVSYLDN